MICSGRLHLSWGIYIQGSMHLSVVFLIKGVSVRASASSNLSFPAEFNISWKDSHTNNWLILFLYRSRDYLNANMIIGPSFLPGPEMKFYAWLEEGWTTNYSSNFHEPRRKEVQMLSYARDEKILIFSLRRRMLLG